VGSIVSGKLANLTILEDNPVTCDPSKIKDIKVWGMVHEGRKLPVMVSAENPQAAVGPVANELTAAVAQSHVNEDGSEHPIAGCVCTLNRVFASVFASLKLSEAGV
jgi:hypothetical protein